MLSCFVSYHDHTSCVHRHHRRLHEPSLLCFLLKGYHFLDRYLSNGLIAATSSAARRRRSMNRPKACGRVGSSLNAAADWNRGENPRELMGRSESRHHLLMQHPTATDG